MLRIETPNPETSLEQKQLEIYCAAHTLPESDLLVRLAEETRASTDLPQMMVGQLEGAFLRMLVRLSRAKHVLEIGTFTGYSSLSMAPALPADGTITTLDVNADTVAIAQRYWDESPDGHKIRSILGPARESLQELAGPFDLIFIDADKSSQVEYWELLLPKVPEGGLILVDNVLYGGQVVNPEDGSTARDVADFNAHVHADSRVEAVMLTVRDGMTLAWKR
ncbi:MAG: caffeoyl-CoA O-methyltransferase [Planctomycetota bacterium]|jgi:caffeoyl-CoA O-methyltransferase